MFKSYNDKTGPDRYAQPVGIRKRVGGSAPI